MKWWINLLVPPCSFYLECGKFKSLNSKTILHSKDSTFRSLRSLSARPKALPNPQEEHVCLLQLYCSKCTEFKCLLCFARGIFLDSKQGFASAFILELPLLSTKVFQLILRCKTLLAVSSKPLHFHSPFLKYSSVSKSVFFSLLEAQCI